MLGPLTREQILAGRPDWQAVVDSYAPSLEAVEQLKSLERPVQVEVYLGTWCSDSQKHVSEFFKVLDLAGTPLLIATYIGIPKQKDARLEYYGGEDIPKLPTLLVVVDGGGEGRVIERPVRARGQEPGGNLSR